MSAVLLLAELRQASVSTVMGGGHSLPCGAPESVQSLLVLAPIGITVMNHYGGLTSKGGRSCRDREATSGVFRGGWHCGGGIYSRAALI